MKIKESIFSKDKSMLVTARDAVRVVPQNNVDGNQAD